MIAASAAQKKPAEIPQSALPKSRNHVFEFTLLVYSPAPYRGYPIAPSASPYLRPIRLLIAPAATQTMEKSPYTKALAAETAYGSAAPPAPRPPRASHMPGAVNDTPHAIRIWKGTDRKKDLLLLIEPLGSCVVMEDMTQKWGKEWILDGQLLAFGDPY